ncbi:hypothetical protein [Metabacillus sp. Hm71]|uniref:hypothetical protein n=1 Tax=Metabacillus sp. Hm71 TaxID=3450743 RepID=UPI003F41B5F4
MSRDYENSSMDGRSQQMEVQFDMQKGNKFTTEFFKGENEKLLLTFNKSRNVMVLDRRNTEYSIVNLGTKNDFTRS